MKKGLNLLLGCGALLFALALNLNYAMNDYGILENSLSTQVLAQSTTTGSNSNGSNSNGSDSNGSGSDEKPKAKGEKVGPGKKKDPNGGTFCTMINILT